jgi:syndecan 1
MADDAFLTERCAALCAELFAGLPRKDQRRRGTEYVHGLLRTPGRKSIRNIAGQANEQRLHHFVSDSTWDWTPVRRALRRHLLDTAPPQAWVIRSLIIPKAGEHTVGVARRYCSTRGASLNAQHAVGVWAATPERAVPVGWRLHLSPTWLADADRRRRAAIPAAAAPQPVGECLADAYLELFDGPHDRPVALDARDVDAAGIVRRLRAAGAPVIARIDPDTPLWTCSPLAGHGREPIAAGRLIGMDRQVRRPLFGAGGGLAATLPVRLTGSGRRDDLLLLGVGGRGQRDWPGEVWLTDLTDRGAADLVRLGGLLGRVDEDLAVIGDRVGLRDFTGRSFAGWHRHVTLASAAHALVALHDPALVTHRRAS